MTRRPRALVSTLLSLVLWLAAATASGALRGDADSSVRATPERQLAIGAPHARLASPAGDRQRRAGDGGHAPVSLHALPAVVPTPAFSRPVRTANRTEIRRATALAFPYDATAPPLPASQG